MVEDNDPSANPYDPPVQAVQKPPRRREQPLKPSWLLIVCSAYMLLPLWPICSALLAYLCGPELTPNDEYRSAVGLICVLGPTVVPMLLLHGISLLFRSLGAAAITCVFSWAVFVFSVIATLGMVRALVVGEFRMANLEVCFWAAVPLMNLLTACAITSWTRKLARANRAQRAVLDQAGFAVRRWFAK